jgi:acyl carrier protein
MSSRTPEGSPNRCPVCGNTGRIEPPVPFGEAPCPCCGHLLWFMVFKGEPRFFLREEAAVLRERVLERISANLGVDKDALIWGPSGFSIPDFGVDSLDVVELLMELDEEFGWADI